MTPVRPVSRRTQQERRDATVDRLTEAAIETILEVGYYRTTVKEICTRAGLSVGAMFRQFDSRLALMAKVANDVTDRILDSYAEAAEALATRPDPRRSALEFLAYSSSAPLTDVWRELMMAARTDVELRDMVAPSLPKLYEGVFELTDGLGLLADIPERSRRVTLFSMMHMFSGATLTRPLYPLPDIDEQRITLAAHYMSHTPAL
ncbi:TetR/AcrR family transcriptional regulator [Antrihabitans sp. YC2-6]|uniref:TetR/AcrR family transcriptional regulator n=1 Tax=Antrihabitans sp. YC2-6 TaxID=2799498 RepID=UPI0018F4A43C|nr:TetR/AcrR family transcriptional regulator [Antrihabitans sp. YC2-6]MBJ8347563.1 TetR/AcrR family transcriptional regulator [Antrihabitans sp. YC2-6]